IGVGTECNSALTVALRNMLSRSERSDTQRVSNGGRIEVINETPSGVTGVKNIEYKTLQADIAGNPIAGQYVKNGEIHIKTVYDPNVYPEAQMKDLGYRAFKDAMDKNTFNVIDPLTNEVIPRTFKGVANGKTIMGHYKTVNGENIISSWWIIQ
ncbi:CdiA family toxin C-terminal domain-containing protein, partial [Flavobacterium covae]